MQEMTIFALRGVATLVTNDYYLWDMTPPLLLPVVQINDWCNISMISANYLTILLVSLYRSTFLRVHVIILNRGTLYRLICHINITFNIHICTCYNIMRKLRLVRFYKILVLKLLFIIFIIPRKSACVNPYIPIIITAPIVYHSDMLP